MGVDRIVKPKESLRLQELKTPKPKGSSSYKSSSSRCVCHSNIHLCEGDYEVPEGQFLKIIDIGVNTVNSRS